MLKGVNLQVIEVNDPAGKYFQRVLYVVKPECAQTSRSKLLEEAERLGKNQTGKPPHSVNSARVKSALKALALVLVGAVVAAVICLSIVR